MPIVIDKHGMPYMACDVCGEPVSDGKDLYAWTYHELEEGERPVVSFLHSGMCFMKYETFHEGDASTLTVDALLIFLAERHKIDLELAQYQASLLADVDPSVLVKYQKIKPKRRR